MEERRAQVTRQALGLLNRLEAELNANVFLTSGLIAYMTAVREINAQEIGLALQALHEMGHHIRNIGLAPGNRITHVYPLKGNRAAVGLYHPQLDEQWPAVKKAIDMRQTMLAGPIELRQGGSGLISRTPVFLRNGDYWGLPSTVLDTHSLLDAAGMAPEVAGTRFALRGCDASGPRSSATPTCFTVIR